MTEITKTMKTACENIAKLYKKKKFMPEKEAEIQAFIFGFCFEKLKNKKISLERWSPKIGEIDINIGDHFFAEIKYRKCRKMKNPKGKTRGIIKDIRKLNKLWEKTGGKKRKFWSILFTYPPKGKLVRGCRIPKKQMKNIKRECGRNVHFYHYCLGEGKIVDKV